MANMDDIFQVEMSHKSGQVVSVMVHIVAVASLSGASMATAVMGDHAIAMMQEEQHLRVPIIGRKRPAMAEHNRLTFTPVFIVDRDAILCRDRVHLLLLAVAFASNCAPAVHGGRDKFLSAMRTSVCVSWRQCTAALRLNLPRGYFPEALACLYQLREPDARGPI